jgi:hypothetical protein
VAKRSGELAGFVAVTPPSAHGYSLDRYFPRECVPLIFDRGIHEVRLLTVTRAHRGMHLAFLIMYGALRNAEAQGARTIAAIGRLELFVLYRRAGLKSLGLRATSGEVTYELMTADVRDLQAHLASFDDSCNVLDKVLLQLTGVRIS